MADHADLIKDMQDVEKLPTVERMKVARKRRQQQLKKYAEYEKKQEKVEKNNKKNARKSAAAAAAAAAAAGVHRTQKKPAKEQVRFSEEVVFLEATTRNDVEEVTALLQRGVSPNVANEDGLTALHQSCIDDCEEMVLLLLQYGANVNAKDRELWTPLHAAATCGHARICQHLIEMNADLLAVNSEGNMPYDICEDEPTLELIETSMANAGITQDLIDHTRLCLENDMLDDLHRIAETGGDLETRDRQGAVPLHAAAANGYEMVAAYLLEKGVDINAVDMDGWTPAHAAACWGHVNILTLLASHGADLDSRTKNEETLLDLCEDEALRLQIEEVKRQAQTYREQRKNMPWHRHSSTHSLHGSSVRRHSMREKRRLSLVEAKEEGKMFSIDKYDVPVTNIDDVELLTPSPPIGGIAGSAMIEGLSEHRGSLHLGSSAAPPVRRVSSSRIAFSLAEDGHPLVLRTASVERRAGEPTASLASKAGGDDDRTASRHKYERRLSAAYSSHDAEHILRALTTSEHSSTATAVGEAYPLGASTVSDSDSGDEAPLSPSSPPPPPPATSAPATEHAGRVPASAAAATAAAVKCNGDAASSSLPGQAADFDASRGVTTGSLTVLDGSIGGVTTEPSDGAIANSVTLASAAAGTVLAGGSQNGVLFSRGSDDVRFVRDDVAYPNSSTSFENADSYLSPSITSQPLAGDEPLMKFTSQEHEIVGGHEHKRCCTII